MNEASLRQRLGDGTDPAVMSPQKQGEERERDETSHSFLCSLALPGLLRRAHPCFSCPVMGSCYRLLIHTPAALSPTPTPTPTLPDPPWLSSRPCPALPVPAPQTLAPLTKIPISRPCSGAQAQKAANLVHVCAHLCLYVCRFNRPSARGEVRGSGGTRPVHYSHHGKRGVANQYLVTAGPACTPVSLRQALTISLA